MKYVSGRNWINGYTGTARSSAELSITEKDGFVHVSGTGGTSTTVYVIPPMATSIAILDYMHSELGGEIATLCLTVKNNGMNSITVRLNGVDGTVATIPAGETATISKTGTYQSGSNLQVIFQTLTVGAQVDFSHSVSVYGGFGEPPETISLAPELKTSAGTMIGSDSMNL